MTHFRPTFTAQTTAQRTRFGAGIRRDIAAELNALGAERALVLCTPQQTALGQEVMTLCGPHAVGLFAQATMHTPIEVSEEATALALRLKADVVIAAGGGSTIGLGKAIAWRTDLPQIALPTTYAGSEATPILGQTEAGVKTTLTSPKVQPEVILYDAELVTGLPTAMTVASSLNAMAHAAEGLYARNASPLATLMAAEGLRAFRDALPRVLSAPHDLAARGETLYGAWLSGTVLGQVGMALHHKLCHTLGGAFNLPHAETHAILLPHAIAYNAAAAHGELAPLRALFGADVGGGLYDFATRLGAPRALRDLGVSEAQLDHATDLALKTPYWNPRALNAPDIRALLQAAWQGRRPEA